MQIYFCILWTLSQKDYQSNPLVYFIGFTCRKTSIILGSVIGGVVLLAAALVLFGYCWCQRAKAQEKTAILTAKMTGYEDEVEFLVHF